MNNTFSVDIESIYPSLGKKDRFRSWFPYQAAKHKLRSGKDYLQTELTNGERGNNKLKYYLTPNAAALIIFGTDLPVVVQIIKSIAFQAKQPTTQPTKEYTV